MRWVHDGRITPDSFCTAQGVIKQCGSVGVAFSTLSIAVYTFIVLFLRLQLPSTRWLPLMVIGLICLFIFMITVIASQTLTNPPYYGPSRFWCWINPKYGSMRLGTEYALMWLTAFMNILLYVPLFLVLRGNIQVDLEGRNRSSIPKVKLTWKTIQRDDAWNQGRKERKESNTIATQMLAYPIVYIILILPMSIVRWTEPRRSEWSAFAGVIYNSSGLVNSFLYVVTRPSLFPSWRACRRRIQGSEEGNQPSLGNGLRVGAAGTLPELTVFSAVASTTATGGSFQQSTSRICVPPPVSGAPMLNDDDETEDGGHAESKMKTPGNGGWRP
ncbi:hypothetical protein FRC03_001795 [Tulasnella sp. 419]|nr:hypothetical protein FRC03_001795 [Tulasnella sp. 419]